jgi:signal transduction histidine kinase/ActR/RegA family two-component response regulator
MEFQGDVADVDYGVAFLEASPDGVLLVDTAGRILAFNSRFVRMWSIPADVVTSRSDEAALASVVDQLEKPADFLGRVAYLYDHPAETSLDLVALKDGRTFERYSAATLNADGTPAGRMWFFRDISDRRQMETRLALAERLASVGTLAAGIAHEINNPLSYVRANLDLILEELDEIPNGVSDLRNLAEQAREGAERVRKIVYALKTFARPDDLEKQAILNVESVLELSLNMAFNEVRHVAHLKKDYRPIPNVRGGDVRLGQVFVNLIVNAAQSFATHDSTINEVRVATYTDAAGRAVIEVGDNGAGIPASVIGRIFDPFFTTKSVGVGTGLGLSISHHIVSSMKGELSVVSEVGRGTTFRVVLPPAPPETKVAPAPASHTSAEGRRAKILIVDDEPSVSQALGRVLRAHLVTIASSSEQALQLLATDRSYDIIFCDLMMPGMSGIELYEEVSRRWADVVERMVFVTGGAANELSQSFLDRVSNERIDKPFALKTVRELVSRLVLRDSKTEQSLAS